MFTAKSCVHLILLLGLSGSTYGSLLVNFPFSDHLGLKHRQNIHDLVSWDPFEDDPFEMDFFRHSHDLYFPRIHWAWPDHHLEVPHSLVTTNDRNHLRLSLDVTGFDPKELSLKLVGRELLVTGEHNCRQSQNEPCFQRRFCWRRTLPEDVDLTSVKASLTASNVLEVDATKSKAYESDIKITFRERPKNKVQHRTDNMEHAQGDIQEPKMEEEATVEVIPDDVDAKYSE